MSVIVGVLVGFAAVFFFLLGMAWRVEHRPDTNDDVADDSDRDPTPLEQWEVTEGRDVSEPLPDSTYP